MANEFSQEEKLALKQNLKLLFSKSFLVEIVRQDLYFSPDILTHKELYCEMGFYFHPENGEIIEISNYEIPKQYMIWPNAQYAILKDPQTNDYAYIMNAKTEEKIPANFKKARFEIKYHSRTQSYEMSKMEYLGARAPNAQKIIEESMIQFNKYQEKRSQKLCNKLKRLKRRLEIAINPDKKTIFE